MLATAESCTGGLLAATVTSVPGSSAWFERGFIVYTNVAKQQLLSVSHDLLKRYGAVSEPVAIAMAEGAVSHSSAQTAIAVTGIAGPSGGTPEKPVGTVYIAWHLHAACTATAHHFHGDRTVVRERARDAALEGLLQRLTR